MSWCDDPITEKQIQAIINLTGFLDKEDYTIPATKGEAKDLITMLIEEMKVKNEIIKNNKFLKSKMIYGDFGDYEEEEDEFNQEYDPSWDEGVGL